jgi:phage virion morphogenesis protein
MAIDGRIKIERKAVDAGLYRLRLALPIGGDMTPAMKGIGRVGKTGTQQRFRQQKSPEGKPWKPSKRVLEHGGQTLRLTGGMQRSVTYHADHASVEVGTNKVQGAILHFGGMTGLNHRTRIDARPWVGVSADDEIEMLAVVNEFLGRAWKG